MIRFNLHRWVEPRWHGFSQIRDELEEWARRGFQAGGEGGVESKREFDRGTDITRPASPRAGGRGEIQHVTGEGREERVECIIVTYLQKKPRSPLSADQSFSIVSTTRTCSNPPHNAATSYQHRVPTCLVFLISHAIWWMEVRRLQIDNGGKRGVRGR